MADTYYLTDSSGNLIAAGSKEYTQQEAAKYLGSGYIVTPTGGRHKDRNIHKTILLL